jgi:hypothetical protein
MDSLPRRRRFRRVSLAVLLALAWASQTLAVNAATDLASVIKAWNDRQAAARSLHFSWSGEEFCSGDLSAAFAGLGHGRARKGHAADAPPPDTSFEIRMEFFLDARGRVRFDAHGKQWSGERREFVPTTGINVFNGQCEHTFFPNGVKSFPSAHISADKASDVANDMRLLPIRIVYRPFDATMGVFNSSQLALTAEKGVVDGQSCAILRQGIGRSLQSVWVDASRDCVPVRYITTRDGRARTQIDISYAKDDKHGWVPNSWNILQLTPVGGTLVSFSATTVKCAINETIPDNTFQLSYPVGTWVSNNITDETYILQEGDTKRPILAGEFTGDNYEELLHSKPGLLGVSHRTTRILVCLAVVLVLACWFFLRRRQRMAAP